MAEKSQETLMQEMIDGEAIRTLAVRYGHCVWQKDVDGYVDLFTEDGESDRLRLATGAAGVEVDMTIEGGLVDALWSHQAGPVTAGRWRCGMHLNRVVWAAARDGGRSARSSIRRPSFPAVHGYVPTCRRRGAGLALVNG